MSIKTFVFLDCETTGLPAFECNKTKITELCLISCQAEHIALGAIPRVKNKLNLCFNPLKRISPTAEKITGLYNDDLSNEGTFNETSLNIITNYLQRLSKPICFVAHNGFNFDYPILRNHIEFVGGDTDNINFPQDIYCIDSLRAFRQIHKDLLELQVNETTKTLVEEEVDDLFDDWDELLCNELTRIEESLAKTPPRGDIKAQQLINETTPTVKVKKECDLVVPPGAPARRKQTTYSGSAAAAGGSGVRRRLNFKPNELNSKQKVSFQLTDVYERVVGRAAQNAHEAEGDVQMLIEIVLNVGDKFIDYANKNMIRFNCVPKMEPGKKIGLPEM